MSMDLLANLLEEITTGTGASMTTGQGEQIATPNAFKRKRRLIRKDMSEADVNVSSTPEKREQEYQKYLKAYDDYKSKVERYINVFEAYDIKTLMDEVDKAEKFAELGEKMWDELRKIENKLDEYGYDADDSGDKEMYDKMHTLSGKYYNHLVLPIDKVYEAMQDIVDVIKKIKEK